MVTRAGVAKRLGLSIASVRRMEGRELHPWTDERGVHQFDANEVEQLARGVRARSGNEENAPFADDERNVSQHRLQRLEGELAEVRQALDGVSGRCGELESENQEMRTTAIEALELVEVLLGPETPYVVHHCLYDLRRRR
jgi:hypothetical protein